MLFGLARQAAQQIEKASTFYVGETAQLLPLVHDDMAEISHCWLPMYARPLYRSGQESWPPAALY